MGLLVGSLIGTVVSIAVVSGSVAPDWKPRYP